MTSHREPLRLLQATALGDAHGLLTEGLSPGRLARRYPQKTPLFGVWPNMALVSDDTEHAVLTAHAWACSGQDPARFVSLLSKHLRKWLWCLPPATGFATARALIKRSAGWPSHRSGVYSAGNGPCMRAPILGSVIDDPDLLWECVKR